MEAYYNPSTPGSSIRLDDPNQGGLFPNDANGDGEGGQNYLDALDQGRQRVSKACDACSRRRTRCSGGQPCDRCTQKRLTCSYNRGFKKRGPAKGSVMSVHKRLKALEELVISKGVTASDLRRMYGDGEEHKEDSDEDDSGDDNYDQPANLPVSHRVLAAPSRRHNSSTPTGVDSPANTGTNFRRESEHAASDGLLGMNRQLQPAGGMNLPHPSQLSRLSDSPYGPSPNSAMPQNITSQTFANATPFLLPFLPPEVLMDFVHAWDAYTHTGVMHKPTLFRNPAAYPTSYLLAIYMSGCRSSEHPILKDPERSMEKCIEILYHYLKPLLIPVIMDEQPATHYDVMAVLLSGVSPLSTHNQTVFKRLRRFVTYAIALAKEIDLNMEVPDSKSGGNWIAAEERRRVWWNLVSIDRLFSASINAEPQIAESDLIAR
ncbi:hypothetical protein M427DRAFT_312917 [Gonapodya prolifera JEL478]|uniref:Zn(2)-C6 fungal-type domain-containing protein n=1 Tax=Gonapodya prolifera (strain JEL478) TaxID=1344416 RepID=A0A139AXJ5_GONPJ|nr:hypothetical protein M427DRAFT_312917 [Gonapodya prolifera JEL478]|eukprot:KXS21175.1 hypothetical protein M427DRAFT_312917 [Gonapodya prolifera JEL478]